MNKITFAAVASFILTACVGTPHTMSDQAEKLKASMTPEAARLVVGRNMASSDQQLGLCAHSRLGTVNASGGFAQDPAVLDGTTIRYQTIGIASTPSHVSGNVLKGQGVLHIKSSLQTLNEFFELTNLDRIWLGKTSHAATCKGRTGGTYVVLDSSSMKFDSKSLVFHVNDQSVDEFLAALTYLSPSAPVKSVGN